jgi:hypothetical protein
MAITPATRVSKALRRAGFNPGHPSTMRRREGIYVSNALADIPRLAHVTVTVAIDGQGKALRMAAAIAEALTSTGHTVIPNSGDGAILNVWEPGQEVDEAFLSESGTAPEAGASG